MTQYDLAAVALVLVFGYGGYRRGLIAFVLQVAGTVLAFALAAVLAPALAPYISQYIEAPDALLRPLVVAGLTVVLRMLFGVAVRELAAALRGLLNAVPPLAFIDRVLGVVPGLALGGLIVLALTLALLTLRSAGPLYTAAAESWLARNVVTRPEAAVAILGRVWDELVLAQPRLGTVPVVAGVGGLWLGALAAWRWRGAAEERWLREAPTRRSARPVESAVQVAEPLAWPRAALGVLTAGGLMALLVLLSRLRA
jgi:uncharacterized membrane protein required for colicin V production